MRSLSFATGIALGLVLSLPLGYSTPSEAGIGAMILVALVLHHLSDRRFARDVRKLIDAVEAIP